MNKLVVPGVIGAATAAAGTAGVVKYKKKKHMENEMSKAIMSVLPQDLTEEERITLTKSIMKGAFESIGLDKLAFVTCAGTLLFKDSFSNIVKEAGEEFKNDIKNEVIDAIASISEEILKEAGVEYGFTAYKDTDGSVEEIFKKIKELEKEHTDAYEADDSEKARKAFNRISDLEEKTYASAASDLRLHDELTGFTLTDYFKDREGYIDNALSPKNMARLQGLGPKEHKGIKLINDDIVRKSKGFKFGVPSGYSSGYEEDNVISNTTGAKDVRDYLEREALPGHTTVYTEKQKQLGDLLSNRARLKDELLEAERRHKETAFYRPLTKLRYRAQAKEIGEKNTALANTIGKAKEELEDREYNLETLKKWNAALNKAIGDEYNLYKWEWY